MKHLAKTAAVALLAATLSASALANHGRHLYTPHHRPLHHGHHSSGWVAPLVFLGLAGAAIGAAASSRSAPAAPPPTIIEYQTPAPVYVAPVPAAPAPAAAQWYYCRSASQYYPYVQRCPEGWQAVPVSPPPASPMPNDYPR